MSGADASVLTAIGTAQVRITTFGYRHGAPPAAHITIDLRHHFRDPHRVSKRLQQMTAHDAEIRQIVRTTPGIQDVIDATAAQILGYLSGPSADTVEVAVGCAGGLHRAATVGMDLAERLGRSGVPITLVHRDIDKGVVDR